MKQRRPWQSLERSLHEIREEIERVLPLALAGPGHRENPFGESFPGIGLIPEAEFPPLDSRTNCLFGGIIGGFDSLMSKKREQVVPVRQRSFCASAHLTIRAAPVFETVPFHSRPHEDRGIQELRPGDIALTESVPTTEDVPEFLEHVLREHIGIRTASAFLESPEFSNHVSPAKLPYSFVMVAAVGGMVIRADHPFENAAQNGSEDFGPTACSYGEIDDQGRDKHPEIAAIPFTFPSRLIDIEIFRIGKALPGLFHYGLKFGANPLDAIAHASQA